MTVVDAAAPPALQLGTLGVLRGPNRWRMGPVATADLLPPRPPDPGVVRARLAALGDAFAQAADAAGEAPAPLLAHVALLLQHRAGARVDEFAAARQWADGRWTVAVAYEEEAAGILALQEAAALVGACLEGAPADAAGAVTRVAARLRDARPGAAAAALEEEARRRGIPVRRVGACGVQLGLGRGLRRVRGVICAATSAEGVETAGTPEALQALLLSLGVPVPLSFPAANVDEAAALARQLGYPVLLEVDEADGRSAWHLGLRDEDALRAAWPAPGEAARVSVAARVEGREHEALVVAGRVRSVVERAAPGEPVTVHPETRAACERVARALDLPVAAVRFRSADPARAWAENGAACTGVDADPDLAPHGDGAAREAAAHLLDRLYPPGAEAAIPVAAVTGTNGKTTTARLLTHFLRLHGRCVGLQHTEGVYVGDRLLVPGDPPSALAAPLLLSNPQVEAAVFETARGGLLTHGLPVARVDVGIVMNVSADHLGEHGVDTLEELARVKGIVAAAADARGHAVLNAEDPRVLAMRGETAARVALFGAAGRAPAAVDAHLAAGGLVAVREGDEYVLRDGDVRIPVARVAEVPLAFGGAAAFQDENVLAALAAGYVLGVPVETLRAGVLSFHPTAEMNRGRMNLLSAAGRRVLVDYAHNVESMRCIAEFARAFPAARRIAVVGMSASRRDADIRACGRALAPGFDHVILRERDRSSPLRPDGEVARLLGEGLAEGGLPGARREVLLRERSAVDRALELAAPGDLVVVLANNVDAVLDQVRGWTPPAPADAA